MAFIAAGLPVLAGIILGATQNKWSHSIACVGNGIIGSIVFMHIFSYEKVETYLGSIF